MSYKEYTVRVYRNSISWFKPGTEIRHREDGPAIMYNEGSESWYQNDLLHREDGPAKTLINGSKGYYINGKRMSEEEFNNRNKSSCDGKVVKIDDKKYQLKEV
jgi:hypothetical protein